MHVYIQLSVLTASIKADGGRDDLDEGPQEADEGRGREMKRTTEILGGKAATNCAQGTVLLRPTV